jgi:hypothetical protein
MARPNRTDTTPQTGSDAVRTLIAPITLLAGYLAVLTGEPVVSAGHPPAARSGPNEGAAPNPAIDMPGYLKLAREAAAHRQSRRVSEDEFIRMSGEAGTVVLDARSKEMYDLMHVRGAINLSFPDIDAVSLPKVLPDKSARILIYCNNNFTPAAGSAETAAPRQPAVRAAFRPKSAAASLNISTYIALYTYGYRNVYELAPLLDPATSKLTFEPTGK